MKKGIYVLFSILASTDRNRSKNKHTKRIEMLPYTMKNVILAFLLSLAINAIQGQASNQSEADVLSRAEVLFAQNNWQEALPLYAQLVSVNPQKPEYNYKFGVCALLGDRSNHRRPIRYLTNAYKTMSNSPELNYYLGLAYYQNEEFANAMKYFNLYLGKLDANAPQRAEILEKVNACLNGMNLEHNNRIAEVIEKNEFQRDNFHRAYRADEFNGMLILKPENFITNQEKTSGENSYVYISEPRGTLYFSSYENNQSTQRDIYKVSLDENGDWGTPEKLSENINTNYDEAYPVLTNNGTTLYFCSKGHSALGGYDVFVSMYDAETKSFSTPENMGMGINSTFDDVLFIPDKSGDFAWYASNRDNLGNNITVYKVRLNNQNLNGEVIMAQNTMPDQSEKTEEAAPQENQQTSIAANVSTPGSTVEQVAPSVKAANKLNARTLANQLADTAYLLVSETKTAIRNLTNKRDRANMISQKKEEQAKNLEVQFQEIMASLPNASSKEEFEQELSKAIRIKKETYQFRMRADQANRIAWSIGKHIKIKNIELTELKKTAGEVQTLSVQGNFDGTKDAFAQMAENYQLADTLTDYTQNILWITKDEVMFNLPESELAFADNLRQGYENNTLLAEAATKEAQKDIPVNVVDNRTQASAVKPKITAVKLIAQIDMQAMKGYNTNILPGDEYELEINFDVDVVPALPLIAPIEFIAMNEQMEDETLEINTRIDATEALPLIQAIDMKSIAFESGTMDDSIEINFMADAIDALPIIQPVLFEALADASLPEEENLEINTRVDATEAYPLIQAIDTDALAYEEFNMDDDIEINTSADAIEAFPLIQAIPFENLAQNTLPADEALEIDTRTDAIDPLQLIAPIAMENLASTDIPDDESLDISIESSIKILPVIQPILDEPMANNSLPEEEELEIRNDFNRISTIPLINPIAYSDLASMEPLDENIEINIEEDPISTIGLIQPIVVSFDDVALNMDDVLEISTDKENINALPLISPVYMDDVNTDLAIADEILEISSKEEETTPIQIYNSIEMIAFQATTTDEPEMDEALEINSAIDQVLALPVITPIEMPAFASNDFGMDDELQISFYIDEHSEINTLTADNASLTADDMKEVANNLPNLSSEYYYLRQTMGTPDNIETSRSDFDMLRTALINPEDLSYEELLYAASLTPNPEDKLKIYNYAFVHIDRDWRAFNNAAVIALNLKDLDKAECYLYQATLISDDNGKILNNLGILDCYKSDFTSAENHFMAAREKGINTDYNMQVVKEVEEEGNNSAQMMESKMGKTRYFDIIGDTGGLNLDQ